MIVQVLLVSFHQKDILSLRKFSFNRSLNKLSLVANYCFRFILTFIKVHLFEWKYSFRGNSLWYRAKRKNDEKLFTIVFCLFTQSAKQNISVSYRLNSRICKTSIPRKNEEKRAIALLCYNKSSMILYIMKNQQQ